MVGSGEGRVGLRVGVGVRFTLWATKKGVVERWVHLIDPRLQCSAGRGCMLARLENGRIGQRWLRWQW